MSAGVPAGDPEASAGVPAGVPKVSAGVPAGVPKVPNKQQSTKKEQQTTINKTIINEPANNKQQSIINKR